MTTGLGTFEKFPEIAQEPPRRFPKPEKTPTGNHLEDS